jgi:hypothetical protein
MLRIFVTVLLGALPYVMSIVIVLFHISNYLLGGQRHDPHVLSSGHAHRHVEGGFCGGADIVLFFRVLELNIYVET